MKHFNDLTTLQNGIPGTGQPRREAGRNMSPEMEEVARRHAQPGYKTVVRLKARGLRIVMRLLAATLRIEKSGWEYLDELRSSNRAAIHAIFHGSQLIPLYLMRNRGITPMASLSKDGDFTTEVLTSLGYGVARGSSSRGGARALLEMVKLLRGGTDVAFTIDGPRGPRHVAKPGIVLLAQKSGVPVLPLGVAYEKSHQLRNWDLFDIPYPFTSTFYRVGTPFTIDPKMEIEAGCRLVEAKLHEAMAEAAAGLALMKRAKGGPAHG